MIQETQFTTTAKTKQAADKLQGLQQRKSFSSIMEQDTSGQDMGLGDLATQSVEMQRSQSGQSSQSGGIRSRISTSSMTSDTSLLQETLGRVALGQPCNFTTVVPGLYRSSYPRECNYAFIQKLKLKTILTLVDKDLPDSFLSFMKANSIRHRHMAIQGTKKEAIPIQKMESILAVVHDTRNHPLLIHCNHGRHRTGCVVGIVRKIQNWDLDRVLDEYKAHAAPKSRDCDVQYITNFQVRDIQHLGLVPLPESVPPHHAVDIRRIRYLFAAVFAIVVWCITIRLFRRQGRYATSPRAFEVV